MAHLRPVRHFEVQVLNRALGLLFEHVLLGASEEDVLDRLAREAPDCHVVEMREVYDSRR